MIEKITPFEQSSRALACLLLLICCSTALMAQDHGGAGSASGSAMRVTHVLGFESVSNNANGELSIQEHTLRFQKSDGSVAQVSVDSIQDLSLGVQDKQMGGTAMAVGRAAAPYGGGRVIGLFSHKKYDTLTVEYLDPNGGFHGAVFQLNKGQGQVLKDELVAEGAHVTNLENQPTKPNAPEAKNESAALPPRLAAQALSVQVDKVDPGDVNIEPAFRVAIYENLLVELAKTKQFKQVFRGGDRNASGPEVLLLKTTVQKYTPGSETRRAVTTVGGATKLMSEASSVRGKVRWLLNASSTVMSAFSVAICELPITWHAMWPRLSKSRICRRPRLRFANRSKHPTGFLVQCRVVVTNCRPWVSARTSRRTRQVGTVNAQRASKHEQYTSDCLPSTTR